MCLVSWANGNPSYASCGSTTLTLVFTRYSLPSILIYLFPHENTQLLFIYLELVLPALKIWFLATAILGSICSGADSSRGWSACHLALWSPLYSNLLFSVIARPPLDTFLDLTSIIIAFFFLFIHVCIFSDSNLGHLFPSWLKFTLDLVFWSYFSSVFPLAIWNNTLDSILTQISSSWSS